jgi:hypothetical protein
VNKKLLILVVFGTFAILVGAMSSTVLVGTLYPTTGHGYSVIIGPWWDTSWSYRKLISINHSQVDSDLTNFPILVNIIDTDLRDDAQDDGDDIAFVMCYDVINQLNHEIEQYDNTTGYLVAWVNVTNVLSTCNTSVYMYYGNSGCSSQENIPGTWDSNYVMVQHLNESSGTLYDSTSNDNDGTNNGATFTSSAKIDGAYDFDSSEGDYISVSESSSLNITQEITISAWVKTASLEDKSKIVSKGKDKTYTLHASFDNDDQPALSIWDGGDGQSVTSTYTITDNSWHYVAGTFSGSQLEIFIDGTSNNTAGYIGDIDTTADDLFIGADNNLGPKEFFNGIIDEVRISNTNRTAGWISTSYNTMHNTSTFISVGDEKTQS